MQILAPVTRKIAWRYLWAKRAEAFIRIVTSMSILGVAVGVAVLVMVMAVMTGFEYELRSKILQTDSHVVVRRVGGPIPSWREVQTKIQSVAGLRSVVPFTVNQALLRTDENTVGLLVRGIDPAGDGGRQLQGFLDPGVNASVVLETVPDEEGVQLPALVIGRDLARTHGILTGQRVSLLSSHVASSPFGLMPRFKRFEVSSIYSSGLTGYESALAYMNLRDAQSFFRLGDTVTGFEVRVVDENAAPAIARQILDALGGVGSGMFAQDWTESNRPLWEAIKLEKRVYFLVLLLIIVMASFSIISTLVMIVLEKRKDIAILRTLGASAGSIRAVFQLQGAVIGGVGTAAGLLLGYAGCVALRTYGFPLDEKVFQMSQLPVRILPLNFVLVGVSAFLICVVATLYPSARASRVHPVDVLRYE